MSLPDTEVHLWGARRASSSDRVMLCRSSARQDRRMAALKECAKMVTTSAGGCTTAFPFEAAIWLLEEQEELFGGTFPVRTTQVSCGILRKQTKSII